MTRIILPKKMPCCSCKKVIRTGKLKKVIEKGETLYYCTRCEKKRITNKFYNPKRSVSVSKYNMSDAEKNMLHEQLTRQGMSSYDAWKKINRDCRYLNYLRCKNKFAFYNRMKELKQKEKDSKEINKKLVEGLK